MSEEKDKIEHQETIPQINIDDNQHHENYEKINASEFLDISQQSNIQKHGKNNSESREEIQLLKTDQHEKHKNSEFSKTIEKLKNDDKKLQNNDNNNDLPKRLECHHQKKESKFKPIKNLKFCGMRDPVHPALFIENFEQFAAEENLNEEEKQNFFVNSLRKYAAIWMKERGYGTYDEMKNAFLSFYWSSDIQDSFKNNMNTGKYMRKYRLSMGNYFLKHAIGAKYLNNSPSEKEIIDKLIKHFDKNIEDEILIQKAQNIDQVIDILKRIDNLKGTNKITTKLSRKVSMSIISSNEKNSLNRWGWLFLLLAISSVGLSFFSKIFTTK